MGWQDKNFDVQVLNTTLMGCIEDILGKMSGVAPTEPPQVRTLDIIEYDGRMRVTGMEKFNAPSYVSVVNYYLNPADLERHKAKGALVVFVDAENAGKLFKSLGFFVPDDEDEVSMMDACGELCNLLGGSFKNEISNLGYLDMSMSAPNNYRNTVMQGVEFSQDQTSKQEFSFFYWKRKAIVVEVTMAGVPQKR